MPLEHAKAKPAVAVKLLNRIRQRLAQFVRPTKQSERVHRWAAIIVRIYREFGRFLAQPFETPARPNLAEESHPTPLFTLVPLPASNKCG